MADIIRLGGTDQRLYQLVGPLVMDPKVLKQNYNFPFRTTEHFSWFIALEKEQVIGFIPLENKKSCSIINNYYIRNRDADILDLLISEVIDAVGKNCELVAVSFLEDKDTFSKFGFVEEKQWTRYIRMTRKVNKNE